MERGLLVPAVCQCISLSSLYILSHEYSTLLIDINLWQTLIQKGIKTIYKNTYKMINLDFKKCKRKTNER